MYAVLLAKLLTLNMRVCPQATMLARLLTVRGKHQASWLVQFKHLAARALRNTLRNPFPFLLHGVTAVRLFKVLS
jgi:hypothetical protein